MVGKVWCHILADIRFARQFVKLHSVYFYL
jgi:hypothetical protein